MPGVKPTDYRGVEFIQDRVNSSASGSRGYPGAVYLQDEIEIVRPLTATIDFALILIHL